MNCMKPSRLNYAWIIGTLLLLAFAMHCSSKDPLSLLMEDLEEAAEKRDVDAFEKRLAADFSGNDRISQEEALASLRRYFIAYEEITLDITSVERAKSGNRLNFHVSFSGRASSALNLQNLLPSTAAYDFTLYLVQDDGTLKVKKAYWQQVAGF